MYAFSNGNDKKYHHSPIGSDNSLPDRFIVICFIECNVYAILLTCESQCQRKIGRFCSISTRNFYHFLQATPNTSTAYHALEGIEGRQHADTSLR